MKAFIMDFEFSKTKTCYSFLLLQNLCQGFIFARMIILQSFVFGQTSLLLVSLGVMTCLCWAFDQMTMKTKLHFSGKNDGLKYPVAQYSYAEPNILCV